MGAGSPMHSSRLTPIFLRFPVHYQATSPVLEQAAQVRPERCTRDCRSGTARKTAPPTVPSHR